MNDEKEKTTLDPTIVESEVRSDGSKLPSGEDRIPIGSGEIVGKIGEGGMGAVYKIWNKNLEINRALKIAKPGLDIKTFERFKTEAKIAVKLQHSNIVQVYSVGDWLGLPYLEMELIVGDSLQGLLGNKPIPKEVSCAIAICIVRALRYAHSEQVTIFGTSYNGIIHRDLKPENIMISQKGEVKVMDFGLARPKETHLFTTQFFFCGSPQYAAPEQFGEGEVDQRADLYAAGEMLYEMLCGEKAFPQTDMNAIIQSKIKGEFRPLHEFKPRINGKLIRIVYKCLEPDLSARYQNARPLLADLEEAYRDLTIVPVEECLRTFIAGSADSPEVHDKQNGGKRLRWGKLALGGGAVSVAIALIFVFFLTGPKPDQTKPPFAGTQNAVSTQNLPKEQTATEPAPPSAPLESAVKNPQPAPPVSPVKNREPLNKSAGTFLKSSDKNMNVKKDSNAKPVHTVIKNIQPGPKPQQPVPPPDTVLTRTENIDFLSVAQKAIEKKEYDEALSALNKIPAGHPQTSKKILLSLEIYLKKNSLNEAKALIDRSNINAAEFCLYAGKTYMALHDEAKAASYFEEAQEKPALMQTRQSIIAEAAYCTALIRDEEYGKNRSPQNIASVKDAWYTVKKILGTTPDDYRYKKAVEKLSAL